MSAAMKEAADAIKKQAREAVKAARKFKFHEAAPFVAKMKTLIEGADKLPGANAAVDEDEYVYPFDRQSEYLRGSKSAKVIAKIEQAAPDYLCKCDPVKCLCASTQETVSEIKGVRCEFCETTIPVGQPLHVSEVSGVSMCAVCARILVEKVRYKESVAYAVINLIEDACTEVDEPFFQSKAALTLVVEAQERLEQFRKIQRDKILVKTR